MSGVLRDRSLTTNPQTLNHKPLNHKPLNHKPLNHKPLNHTNHINGSKEGVIGGRSPPKIELFFCIFTKDIYFINNYLLPNLKILLKLLK